MYNKYRKIKDLEDCRGEILDSTFFRQWVTPVSSI